MSSICLFGSTNASQLPLMTVDVDPGPLLVGDVLPSLKQHPLYSKICSALNRCAEFLEMPGKAHDMSLDVVQERKPGFRSHLDRRNYSEISICHYVQWVYVFLAEAEAHGWIPYGRVSPAWKKLLQDPGMERCTELVRHFANTANSPEEVTGNAVRQWVDDRVIAFERTFEAAQTMAWKFIRAMLKAGYTQVDPIGAVRLDGYGIPLADFPPPLKEQVEKLLDIRKSDSQDDLDVELDDDLEDLELDDYSERSDSDNGRPKHSQIREITAKLLLEAICRLFGYVRDIRKKKNVNTIHQLFNPRVLVSYRRWLKVKRLVTPAGLRATFVPIIAAMRQSPDFDPKQLFWLTRFRNTLGQLPTEDEIRLRKSQRQLEYNEVAAIPKKIHLEMVRLARKKVDPNTVRGAQLKGETLFRIARLRMFQLAIRWILVLPWRQRNLRQMKLGLDKNLFKAKIPSGFEIDKPDWVIAEEEKNENAEFWMYRFTAEENKTGKLIFCVLPKCLVDPLEKYLECRETLLQGQETETLFANAYGRPMNAVTFGHMMCEISLRYGGDGKKRRGKRMNPHIFRDVFAFAYLKNNPRDFVQLSIQLWHSSIDTTMKHYAGKFNASCGTQAVESFAKAQGIN
jgi:hypothetical protein